MEDDCIRALCDAGAWPQPVAAVELIETHISWVLLTGAYAYKIKKPVDFGFLDFSTLERRRHWCEEEVRLNRRLTPDIYLDVVPVCGPTTAPRIGGKGEVLDYAVRMRQFDTRQGFDQLLARGDLLPTHMDQTAEILAAFHREIAAAEPGSGFGTPDVVVGQVRENFEQTRPCLDQQIADVREREQFEWLDRWSLAASERLGGIIRQRLADGFVRECHGDLHLRNIVLVAGRVVPFDCIEFNPSLRWIDVMSELAFLLMDLDDHGREDLSGRLLNAYLEFTGDYAGLSLLRFYQVYRAMVRAKVESFRLAQLGNRDPGLLAELRRYLVLAGRYTDEPTARLVIGHGLSGSGKTYVSQQLLQRAPLIRLRSDVERKRLYDLDPLEASGSPRDGGIYTLKANTRTYNRLAELAERLLECGYSVLVDAAFLKRCEREQFRQVADEAQVPFAIMHCEAEREVQRERVAQRNARGDDASEADLAVLDLQLEALEPPGADESPQVIHVDTTGDPDLRELLAFFEPAP